MKIISVTGLEKKYGSVQALKGISFDVGRGEIFAMLGPNGSGRDHTTLSCGAAARAPARSRYFRRAGNHGQLGRMPRVGAVFQGRVYYESLTVRELIKYYGGLYRAPPQDVRRYLDMVNLKEKLNTQYNDLSGGQQQQIAIILALVNDPEVLFFDEPSSALDPQVRLKIWELIRNLKSEGKTIIFTTHYIEEAEALADRVSILSKGELVITDSPDNIVRKYNENCSRGSASRGCQVCRRFFSAPQVRRCAVPRWDLFVQRRRDRWASDAGGERDIGQAQAVPDQHREILAAERLRQDHRREGCIMKRFFNFFAMQFVLASRSKIALFWSFVYPVAMLLLFLSVFGNIHKVGASDADPRLVTVTGVFVLTIMSGGIFALVTVLASDFQSGVYKRLKLTDLRPLDVILRLMQREFNADASLVGAIRSNCYACLASAVRGDAKPAT